jgi:signal transduction histidine kinase
MSTPPGTKWFRSFYWRIAVSFVGLLLVAVTAQSVVYRAQVSDADEGFRRQTPNNRAALVAAGLSAALAADASLDPAAYLTGAYGREPWRVFAVMTDGRIGGNAPEPLSSDIRRSAEAALRGAGIGGSESPPNLPYPVVMLPIVVAGHLRGMVVLPPAPVSVARDVGRWLSIPTLLVLFAAVVLGAAIVFGPARRRLAALEDAAIRLGAGDGTARAPESGEDEIARVARAFNAMAADLAARSEALETSDRLRRQMLADVSHELKTPLAAMLGYIETLRMSDVDTERHRRTRYLETVERETRRLARIVRDLVDLARYENGVVVLEPRVFAIERLFDHVVRRYEAESASRRVSTAIHVDPQADQAVADPDRLEQAVDNLYVNALRHTPPGGTIDLRATTGGGAIAIAVVDTGTGIEAAHVPHVFDRFYKADASRAAVSDGSGLGLSIVKAIAVQHGGSVALSSEPGRTEFRIVLPQRADRRPADTPEPPATESQHLHG